MLGKSLAYGLFLLLLCSGLWGCQATPPPAEPEQQPAPTPGYNEQQLRERLDSADAAIARGHLTFPKETSALAILQDILAQNPGQKDALHGLEHIVELHIDKAMAALQRRQMASARSMLARARLILPDHPSIEPTAAQIRLIAEAKRTTVNLSPATVSADDSLEEALHGVARLPVDQSCRFNIWAPSDGQARRIYRALSNQATLLAGVPIERLRAQISIRSPAAVERMCFEIQ